MKFFNNTLIFDNNINLKVFKKQSKLIFSNVKYTSCVFFKINFEDIRFDNVIFENCTFEFCTFTKCSIGNLTIMEFYDSHIYNCNFNNCNFKNVFIKKSKLEIVSFINVYLGQCNLIKNNYIKVKFIDKCNLSDCVIKGNTDRFNIEFVHNNGNTILNLNSYIGGFNFKKTNLIKSNKCLNRQISIEVCNSYLAFANEFLCNNLGDKYGACFYESKRALHKILRGIEKLKSFLSYHICGYGEKPFRAFSFSLIIVFICAIIYLFTGLQGENNVILYKFNNPEIFNLNFLKDFIHCFYFSIVTFATVGYGNIIPLTFSSMIISTVEIILGVVMIGIWTSTLVRKMTR